MAFHTSVVEISPTSITASAAGKNPTMKRKIGYEKLNNPNSKIMSIRNGGLDFFIIPRMITTEIKTKEQKHINKIGPNIPNSQPGGLSSKI
ncbi:hypothetical protein ACFLRR_01690 [Bacteroidota bacterium]